MGTRHVVLCAEALTEAVGFIERNGLNPHLIATSPPHNTNAAYDFYKDDLPLGDYIAFISRFLAAADRVLRPGGRLAVNVRDVRLGPGHFFPILVLLHRELCERRGYRYRRHHVWVKGPARESNKRAWGSFKSSANPAILDLSEPIYVFQKPGPRVRGKDNFESGVEFANAVMGIWEIPPVRRVHHGRRLVGDGHVCPWPVPLAERIVKLYSCVGDWVWDPFGGVGSTAVACALAQRHSISSDISPAYCDRAVQRLHAELPEESITVERVDLRQAETSKPSEVVDRLPPIEDLVTLPAALGEAARVRRAMVHEGAFVAAGRRRMSEGGRRGGLARQGLPLEQASDGSVRPLSRELVAAHVGLSGSKYVQCRRVLTEYDAGRCPLAALYEQGVLRVDAVDRARRVLGLDEQQRIVDEVMARSPSGRIRLARELLRATGSR